MTTTSRKSFWPKRWLRSFAGAALATAVVGGAVWAADPPPGRQGRPQGAPPRTDAPKASSRPEGRKPEAAAGQEGAAHHLHHERQAVVRQVMEWYANETGLAFNSETKPPDGTFAFTAPKDPRTNEPKKYTIAELTDFLNETLLAKGFVLIRGEVDVPPVAGQREDRPGPGPPGVPGRAEDAGQAGHGPGGLPAQALVAAEQVIDVQKVMSKVGEVSVMPGQNALLMIDYAGNLADRGRPEGRRGGKDDSRSDQYRHTSASAGDAARGCAAPHGPQLEKQDGAAAPPADGRGRGRSRRRLRRRVRRRARRLRGRPGAGWRRAGLRADGFGGGGRGAPAGRVGPRRWPRRGGRRRFGGRTAKPTRHGGRRRDQHRPHQRPGRPGGQGQGVPDQDRRPGPGAEGHPRPARVAAYTVPGGTPDALAMALQDRTG